MGIAGETGDSTTADSNSSKVITVDPKDPASVQAFVERHRQVREKSETVFASFRSQFEERGTSYVTTFQKEDGSVEKIYIDAFLEKPGIEIIDLDRPNPVQFKPTSYHVHFFRETPGTSESATTTSSADIDDDDPLKWFDPTGSVEDDEPFVFNKKTSVDTRNSQELILNDLQKKFTDLGLLHINIPILSRRLIGENQQFKNWKAQEQADMLFPIYRKIELKRLLAFSKLNQDSTSYSLEMVTQRQHLYDQLSHLLREAGLTPEKMTKYILEGLFDETHIAGMPVFTDENNDHYVVVDFTYSGYDELDPTNKNSDFAGRLSERPPSDISAIMRRAKEKGYKTRHYSEAVATGTHQRREWYGIAIDTFDEEKLENNIVKVVKILQDVDINPEEIVDVAGDIEDLVIKETDAPTDYRGHQDYLGLRSK